MESHILCICIKALHDRVGPDLIADGLVLHVSFCRGNACRLPRQIGDCGSELDPMAMPVVETCGWIIYPCDHPRTGIQVTIGQIPRELPDQAGLLRSQSISNEIKTEEKIDKLRF